MKWQLAIVLLLTGCSMKPGIKDIRSYGEDKFIAQVLSIADGKPAPPDLLNFFKPLKAEPHLNGAWLVFHEFAGYKEGIYVDRQSVNEWGGSGMAVTQWSTQIAWVREETRAPAQQDAGADAHSPQKHGL